MDGDGADALHVEPIDDHGSASLATVAALESVGVDPTGTRWALNDHVDTDALDRLWERWATSAGRGDSVVAFEVGEYVARVDRRTVALYERSETEVGDVRR
jgi:hypothetical protein